MAVAPAYSQTGYYGNGGGGSDGVSPSGNADPSNQCSSDYGSGGTSVAGGAGGSDVTVCLAGTNAYNGGNGISLAGGNSSNTMAEYSGGGGGGYYGGGAGANFYGSGGGGGSSYVDRGGIYSYYEYTRQHSCKWNKLYNSLYAS